MFLWMNQISFDYLPQASFNLIVLWEMLVEVGDSVKYFATITHNNNFQVAVIGKVLAGRSSYVKLSHIPICQLPPSILRQFD